MQDNGVNYNKNQSLVTAGNIRHDTFTVYTWFAVTDIRK